MFQFMESKRTASKMKQSVAHHNVWRPCCRKPKAWHQLCKHHSRKRWPRKHVWSRWYFCRKREWFDHLHTSLHTSRPKHATDDDGYETASYLKDGSYSTLRQNKNTSTKPNLEYRYILNNMPFSKHQSS